VEYEKEFPENAHMKPPKDSTPLEAVLIGLDQFKDTINKGLIPRAKKGD
jgi:hypothetical protein